MKTVFLVFCHVSCLLLETLWSKEMSSNPRIVDMIYACDYALNVTSLSNLRLWCLVNSYPDLAESYCIWMELGLAKKRGGSVGDSL